jgi:hypothetical protein
MLFVIDGALFFKMVIIELEGRLGTLEIKLQPRAKGTVNLNKYLDVISWCQQREQINRQSHKMYHLAKGLYLYATSKEGSRPPLANLRWVTR